MLPGMLALAICGCASTGSPASGAPIASSERTASQRISDAPATPLSDLNLVRASIPAALVEARHAPYAVPADLSCAGLASQVQAIDEALGPDLDAPVSASNPGMIERGGDVAADAAASAVQGAVEGVVPFRSWVRRLSGAERQAREVAAAIAAGAVRRAYLKGLGQSQGCAAPAAPRGKDAKP
ncbi:MAG: hypothetical protein ACM3PU_01295 [Gemmatimonadota bacterium]